MLRPQGSVGLGLRQRKSYFGFIHPNMQYDFECTCHTSKGICCTVETLGMYACRRYYYSVHWV